MSQRHPRLRLRVLTVGPAARGTAWQCDGMSGQPAEASGIQCGDAGTCSVFVAGRTNGTYVPTIVARWHDRFGEPTKSSEETCANQLGGLIDLRWQRDGILSDVSFSGTCRDV